MSKSDTIKDRALGSMIGLVVGDALGTTIEFLPRGAYPLMTDMIGGGPFHLRPGQWTDDTSMALCLAESLLSNPDLDQIDLMERFSRWVEFGENSATGKCFDIGRTTLASIASFKRTGQLFQGPSRATDAGNGSIMRLAPVALRWWHNLEVARSIAREQSRTTHAASECIDSCDFLVEILCRAIRGELTDIKNINIRGDLAPAVSSLSSCNWVSKLETEIKSDGYVIHTLEAALWALQQSNSFSEAILTAVNLGHDSDTVGAVCGQLAGAIFGLSAIPGKWIDLLHDRDRILDVSRRLIDASFADNDIPFVQ